MNDLSASEKRLIEALDRIDRSIDATRARQGAAQAEAALQQRLADAEAENERLRAQIAAVGSARRQTQDSAEARLAAAGRETAQLAAANDGLTAANRALIDTAAGRGDAVAAVRAALEAEIAAMTAARAAEVGQLSDILTALDSMLGGGKTAGAESATSGVDDAAMDHNDAEDTPDDTPDDAPGPFADVYGGPADDADGGPQDDPAFDRKEG